VKSSPHRRRKPQRPKASQQLEPAGGHGEQGDQGNRGRRPKHHHEAPGETLAGEAQLRGQRKGPQPGTGPEPDQHHQRLPRMNQAGHPRQDDQAGEEQHHQPRAPQERSQVQPSQGGQQNTAAVEEGQGRQAPAEAGGEDQGQEAEDLDLGGRPLQQPIPPGDLLRVERPPDDLQGADQGPGDEIQPDPTGFGGPRARRGGWTPQPGRKGQDRVRGRRRSHRRIPHTSAASKTPIRAESR
jgi:hypothetical protein